MIQLNESIVHVLIEPERENVVGGQIYMKYSIDLMLYLFAVIQPLATAHTRAFVATKTHSVSKENDTPQQRVL